MSWKDKLLLTLALSESVDAHCLRVQCKSTGSGRGTAQSARRVNFCASACSIPAFESFGRVGFCS